MGEFKTEVYIMDIRSLKEEDVFSDYLKQVSPDRQLKINRLKSANAKILSLGAGLLLNVVLTKYKIDPMTPIIRNKNGKPFLKAYPDFHFNLSHSGEFVVCAIAPQAVGVDIQKMKTPNFKVAKRFFHKQEVDFLTNLSLEEKKLGFNQIWAAKESYLKYLGTGLSTPLNSFEFKIDLKNCYGRIREEKIYFKNYKGPENYVIWCCTEIDDFDQKLKQSTIEGSRVIGQKKR